MLVVVLFFFYFFFFQAEDGIRDYKVTGVQTCALPICLNLLFGLPLVAGVCITVVDVMLILALQSRGFRCLESVVIALVAVIGLCFAAQLVWLQPPVAAVLRGRSGERRVGKEGRSRWAP